MFRLTPQSIIAEDSNRYRVRFTKESAEIDYTFSVSHTHDITGIRSEQSEFDTDTFGDPTVELLHKSIFAFDDLRSSNNTGASIKLISLTATGSNKYLAKFENNNRTKIEYVCIMESGDVNLPALSYASLSTLTYGTNHYNLRFKGSDTELEYAFTVYGGDSDDITVEQKFLTTIGTTAADTLLKCILGFHQARVLKPIDDLGVYKKFLENKNIKAQTSAS